MAHREYNNSYPSVTQVLGILRKIGLEIWFKKNTAEFCDAQSKKGREIGTLIHESIQNHIEESKIKIETQYGEEVKTVFESFMKFRQEHPEIKLKKAEMQVTSEKHKYNGTLDCLGNDGSLVVTDWKSGECKGKDEPPIYDEYLYQVAAYVYAYNEQHKANIQKAYILVFAKDIVSYNIREIGKIELEGLFKEVFLSALKIFNFQKRR